MYPRQLSVREREWLEWILPAGRSGYDGYRGVIAACVVIGEGRRGEGEIILGRAGQQPEFDAPLAPVFAYGAIETSAGTVSVTLREQADEQLSLEIVNTASDRVPENFEERRRWTYSTWSPGNPCPQCGGTLREVPMYAATERREHYVLAFCTRDRRIWVHDASGGVNRLIPVTNYYNELMLHKNIRDPKIVLDSQRLFADLPAFTDADLTYAFVTYNKLRTKLHLPGTIGAERREPAGVLRRIRSLFSHR